MPTPCAFLRQTSPPRLSPSSLMISLKPSGIDHHWLPSSTVSVKWCPLSFLQCLWLHQPKQLLDFYFQLKIPFWKGGLFATCSQTDGTWNSRCQKVNSLATPAAYIVITMDTILPVTHPQYLELVFDLFCPPTTPSSDSTRFSQFYQPNNPLSPSPDTPRATSREEAPAAPSVYSSAMGFCVPGHCSSLHWIPSRTSTADKSS